MDPAEFQPNADELIENNTVFAGSFTDAGLQSSPSRNVAIVTCMDARIDVHAALGLANGEAHIIRNAGGVVTDDVIRSLCLSQRALGTREILVIHHSRCGLHNVDEAAFRSELEAELGVKPAWSLEGFTDADADVLQSMERLRRTPFVERVEHVRGFVYDVDDGTLREVAGERSLP